MKTKLVFISSMASPFQVKFCYALQEYFDAEFWFHVHVGSHRPDWWRIELGDKCKILDRVLFKQSKYLSLDVIGELDKFNPDIVVLGGFLFPSNIISYHWAKRHDKKAVVFTEISRNRQHVVRKKRGFHTKLTCFLYRDVDAILASAVEAADQLKNEFGFGDRVLTAQYPCDIDEHLKHPLRKGRDAYVLLYANRLTGIYDPLLAIEVFDEIQRRHPGSRMLMNASGELRGACESRIRELDIVTHIEFLDKIESWNDLHKVYLASDVLILPASFSAGNFTIIESMASGMGIVISNKVLGSNMYSIENGRNGFICNPNVNEFVEAIENYYENPVLLETHGRINKLIVRRYSIAQTAALWYELLSSTVMR